MAMCFVYKHIDNIMVSNTSHYDTPIYYLIVYRRRKKKTKQIRSLKTV